MPSSAVPARRPRPTSRAAARAPSGLAPFATLERAFVTLTGHPRPLSFDCSGDRWAARRADPPRRATRPPPPPRHPLLDPRRGHPRPGRQARRDRGEWTVGLAGVLLPGLRRAVAPLAGACPGKRVDLEAEMLAGLIAAIDRCPPSRARPAGFLCGQAFDAAKRLLRAELAERARPDHHPVSAEPPKPYGHPDLVLADAVNAGAIVADDAELIAATRLGPLSLADAADQRGLAYKTAERRRHRAEQTLVEWIHTGTAPGGFVANRRVGAGSNAAGRPRQGHRPDQRPGSATLHQPPTTPKEVTSPLARR